MKLALEQVEVLAVEQKQEPSEDELRAHRAAAEVDYRFAKHVAEGSLVFTAQLVTEVSPTYWRVETFVGVPA